MLFKLAWKDLSFDRLLSLCQVFALASILAPLLLLFSLRYGILQELEHNLLNDPAVLSLSLDTSYRLDDEFFQELEKNEHVGFVIPEVAALSAIVDLKFPGAGDRVSVVPTKVGDPLVRESGIVFTEELEPTSCFISEDLALRRQVEVGDTVKAIVRRSLHGQHQVSRVDFTVKGIIKQRYVITDSIFVSLPTVIALDQYRSGYEPEIFGTGERPKETKQYFAKFRLFAQDIESVIPLYYYLVNQHLDVSSKVKEIENLHAIDHVLNFVFGVIAGVSCLGGAAALCGLMLSSLKLRRRNFVLLRLMGVTERETYLLVLIESWFLVTVGFVLALLFFMTGSAVFNHYFALSLQGSVISTLHIEHFLLFYFVSLGVAWLLTWLSVKFIFLKSEIADILREA